MKLTSDQLTVVRELNELIHKCNVTIEHLAMMVNSNIVSLNPETIIKIGEGRRKFEEAKGEFMEYIR